MRLLRVDSVGIWHKMGGLQAVMSECGFEGQRLPGQNERVPAALQTLHRPGQQVELAITPIGPKTPGLQAYHTSVVVDGVEFSFSNYGVQDAEDLLSHQHLGVCGDTEVVGMGLTSISADDMERALKPYFQEGTYDLLRKNCNSFSDCALFYLLDIRLDVSYRGLEQLGAAADQNAGVVQALSNGEYQPNPKADKFNLEQVMRELDQKKGVHSWKDLRHTDMSLLENPL